MSFHRMQSSAYLLLLTIAISPHLILADRRLVGLGDDYYHVSRTFPFEEEKSVKKSSQKHLRPKGDCSVAPHCPLTVWGELNLRNIQKVDDANMEISLEITFR